MKREFFRVQEINEFSFRLKAVFSIDENLQFQNIRM